MKTVDSGTPSKSSGCRWQPKSTKKHQQLSLFIFIGAPSSKRAKRLYREKHQVDWTFVLFLLYVIFAFSNFSGILVAKYMLFYGL